LQGSKLKNAGNFLFSSIDSFINKYINDLNIQNISIHNINYQINNNIDKIKEKRLNQFKYRENIYNQKKNYKYIISYHSDKDLYDLCDYTEYYYPYINYYHYSFDADHNYEAMHQNVMNVINCNYKSYWNRNELPEIEDIYPYINEKKINISFKNKYNVIKRVSIPASLRNCELYYKADKINNPAFFEYSDVKSIRLYLKDQLIENNDEQINKIVFDGAQIFIMEINELLIYEIRPNEENLRYLISFESLKDNYETMTPLEQMNCISVQSNNPEKVYELYGKIFLFLNDINKNNKNILKKDLPGKKLNVDLIDKNNKFIGNVYANSLQQIKTFYNNLVIYLSRNKIPFSGKPVILFLRSIINDLDRNERTFSSYGILYNCMCKIDG